MNILLTQHLAALRDALRRLTTSPLNTILSLLVIGIALTLPSAGWLIIDNLKDFTGSNSDVQQISIFMTADAGKKEVNEIESRLHESKLVNWHFVAKDEALKRLQNSEDMAEIIASLPRNPLPDAFVVELTDTQPQLLEELAKLFAKWPKVAHVQLDSAWIKRLDTFLRIGKLFIALLATLLACALVTVTFNTIRLQILAQSAEIEVAKLIGATDTFIRRPFQYFGALQGMFGGLLAALIVSTGSFILITPMVELIELYSSNFVPHGPSHTSIATLAVIGTLLGWLGAQLSVTIHLRRLS